MTVLTLEEEVARLEDCYANLPADRLVEKLIRDAFPGRVAVVASFGAESAVLLRIVAEVDRDTPVLFLDTGKHFPETLAYRDHLSAHLGLSNLRTLRPWDRQLQAADPDGLLWTRDADYCCRLRKVLPLEDALVDFDCWISGRKRYHGGDRAALKVFEPVAGKIQVNPLLHLDDGAIHAEFVRHGLPRHPLADRGYTSIGCAVCTARPPSGGGVRAGRWPGRGKFECGIHARPPMPPTSAKAPSASGAP